MERIEICFTRLRLTEDELAKDVRQHLNVQLLEASISMEHMFAG